METEIQVPIYLVMGFLESGKTSFINFTMEQEYFQIEEPTLLIACEEGEEEYDKSTLLSYNTFLEMIEEPANFTLETLQAFQDKYHPDRVLLEFNSFWDIKQLFTMKMPQGWGIAQQIVTVDGSTFDVYISNMKSLFMEMARDADMVLFNRCSKEQPLANYRRSIKIANPGAEILFEDQSGELTDIFEDGVPYDLNHSPITVDDVDYGIFYVDLRDNPERYAGKMVQFKGKVLKSKDNNADYFLPGRMAMTCCADDTSYIGYVCKSAEAKRLTMGRWVQVTAEVKWEYSPFYKQEGPIFYARKIKKTNAPEVEMVYFN